jgi:hypothetical protein
MVYIEKFGHGGDLLTARQLFRKDTISVYLLIGQRWANRCGTLKALGV